MADRLFLDANVLFSAAYGSPSIERLWDAQRAGSCRLLVSRYVIEEARRNLREPEQIRRLDTRLQSALVVPESPADRCPVDLPDKDRPVFSAAAAAGATHLITGDGTHFGAYYGSTVAGLTILRPSDYLRPAPAPQRELAALDAHAEELNREAREVLEYQDDS